MRDRELGCKGTMNLVFLCFAGFIGIGMLLSSIGDSIEDNSAQNERMEAFGEELMSMCKNPERGTGNVSITEPVPLLILENGNDWGHFYMDRLSDEWLATGADDVDYVVCVDKRRDGTRTTLEVCEYTRTSQSITRYQYDPSVYLIDTSNGQTVASTTLIGGTPDRCPTSIRSNRSVSDLHGSLPPLAELTDWILSQ